MPTFDISVTRDGRWWMITVPELDGYESADGAVNVGGLTQARHEGEVDLMAREYIYTVLGIRIETVSVVKIDG